MTISIENVFDYGSVEYSLTLDTEYNIVQVSADLLTFDDDNSEQMKIGHASLFIFNRNYFFNWIDVLDAADSISEDIFYVIKTAANINNHKHFEDIIIILDNMKMKEQYNNNKIKQFFLEKIPDTLLYFLNDGAYYTFMPEALCSDTGSFEYKEIIEHCLKRDFSIIENSFDEQVCIAKSIG